MQPLQHSSTASRLPLSSPYLFLALAPQPPICSSPLPLFPRPSPPPPPLSLPPPPQVVLFHGTHGEMFLYPRWVDLIAGKIKERCGLLR